ncbi:MAG: arginyltransferase [Proteobacteria bacterium]|nr:arginyltransferase [Pseudomonadota bacterium]MBU1709937.1 arginyltransferase [Pseudomonadota bacterium]
MIFLDEETRADSFPILSELCKYFLDVPTECPYGLPFVAIYRQARFETISEDVMQQLFAAGFRRNGNCFYTMQCRGCNACVPIRMNPTQFKPNRNQKRVSMRNKDVEVSVCSMSMENSNLALLNRFLDTRYPGRGNDALGYYSGFFLSTFGNTFEIRYKVAGELLGIAIVDICASLLNAVYFYFNPDEEKRSLGTFNILTLIELGKQQGIEDLYLGYWIEDIQAMSYKAAFKPHYLLQDGQWHLVDRKSVKAKMHLISNS